LLLDRKRVKFWQKIIFSLMAFLMVIFAFGAGVAYIGCNNTKAQVTPSDRVKTAAARVKKRPDDPAARLNLATAWLQLANVQEQGSDAEAAALRNAARAYKNYMKLLQGNGEEVQQLRLDAALALVGIYTRLESWDDVSAAYGVLTELQPENADNFVLWGQAAENAGRPGVAILAYRKYLELAPEGLYAKDVRQKLKELEEEASASPAP